MAFDKPILFAEPVEIAGLDLARPFDGEGNVQWLQPSSRRKNRKEEFFIRPASSSSVRLIVGTARIYSAEETCGVQAWWQSGLVPNSRPHRLGAGGRPSAASYP